MSDRSQTILKDVRDLYRLKGADAIQNAPVREWSPSTTMAPSQTDALGSTMSGGKRMFTCIRCDEMTASLKSSDLVHGFLTHGDVSLLYGSSNVGKSFFALDLAACVATGTYYRGKTRVEGGAVIYITLEGQRTFRNRIAALKMKGRLHPGAPLYIINSTFSLLEPADSETLVNTVLGLAAEINKTVRLIVIDTLSRAMAGGDESSSVNMSEVVQAVDKIRRATDAHVMLVHHCGKDAGRGARGHSSLRAAVDTEIELFRNDDESITFAQVTKQRDLPCIPPMAFSLEPVDLGLNDYGETVTSCTVVHNHDTAAVYSAKTRSKNKPAPRPEQILALVRETGSIQKKVLQNQIRVQLGASVLGASAALTEMLQGGLLLEEKGKSSTGQNTVCITRP
ncbi:AAA family ATPase [Prosthecobacter sp.]|jgi:KaiC/GvpD/RAD55 family RecA-like ATPase|uniref:AAA family ATPase n=1 Tax=Prosthecobacter sp. TaxID=1965333 RepID=UPI0037C4FBBF